jgi:hypothetical protein
MGVTVWRGIRAIASAFLGVFDPFIRLILNAAILLLVVTAFGYRYGTNVLDFPFWPMIGCALVLAAVLAVYEWLIRRINS